MPTGGHRPWASAPRALARGVAGRRVASRWRAQRAEISAVYGWRVANARLLQAHSCEARQGGPAARRGASDQLQVIRMRARRHSRSPPPRLLATWRTPLAPPPNMHATRPRAATLPRPATQGAAVHGRVR